MSAREAKNPATKQFTKIDDLVNVETKEETNINVNVKEKVNSDFDDKREEILKKASTIGASVEVVIEENPIAALKAKMQASKAKESNKQVTVYLTPKNYERFNQLKEKGQKSELINQLLDMYFAE